MCSEKGDLESKKVIETKKRQFFIGRILKGDFYVFMAVAFTNGFAPKSLQEQKCKKYNFPYFLELYSYLYMICRIVLVVNSGRIYCDH